LENQGAMEIQKLCSNCPSPLKPAKPFLSLISNPETRNTFVIFAE
jgi:hypothetical protein